MATYKLSMFNARFIRTIEFLFSNKKALHQPDLIPEAPIKENKSEVPGDVDASSVESNSVRFCLYKYTYIWELNGRHYWAFLLNVDRRSIAGFRWLDERWIYFGVDLRRIDSFVCYNR